MLWWAECTHIIFSISIIKKNMYIYIYCLHCNHTLRALRSEGVNLHASNGIFLGRAYDRLRRRTKSLCTVIYVPGDRRSFEIRLRPISVRQSKWSNDSSQSAPSSAKRVRVLHRSLRRISGSQKWEGKMTPSDAFHRSNKVKELESSI